MGKVLDGKGVKIGGRIYGVNGWGEHALALGRNGVERERDQTT